MGSRFEESVYQMLSSEPVTANEVARELEISHKTALRALMHLALTTEDVFYKNSGGGFTSFGRRKKNTKKYSIQKNVFADFGEILMGFSGYFLGGRV